MQDLQVYLDQDYIDILGQVLQQRKTKNDQYSLRALARDIGLAPSRLSTILNRKSHLSLKSAQMICERLEWGELESLYFLSLVKARVSQTSEARWEALKRVRAIRLQKAYERFNTKLLEKINWRHFVVRFLITTDPLTSSLEEIAHRVGISTKELQEMIDLLCQLGLLKESQNGFLSCEARLAFDNDHPSQSAQVFHRSMLKKALLSLREDKYDRRFFRSCIFTLNQRQYHQLQIMIIDFVSTCTDLDEGSEGPHDDVYALAVQLFPLTKQKGHDGAACNHPACNPKPRHS